MKERIHSFASRLTRRVIVTMFIIMMLIATIIFLFATAGMSILANEHFADIQEITNAKVTSMLRTVEISAVNNVDEIQFYLDNPGIMQQSIASELELNSHLTGCGVGFIPNYYPSKGKWFELYARFADDGKVEVRQIGSSAHDYFNTEWYKGGLASRNGYWSDPYYDDAGAYKVLCTYAMPVRDKSGKTVGVYGADLSLDWLYDQLSQSDLEDNLIGKSYVGIFEGTSYSFILGHDGEYIVHPDKERILNGNYFDYGDSTATSNYYELGRKMLAREGGTMRVDIDGVSSFAFFSPLEKTGWSMAIIVPIESLLQYGIVTGLIILILILIGVLIVSVFCYGTIKYATRPLRQLATSADEVSKGNFQTEIPKIRYNDEVGLLRDSFQNMQNSLTQYIDQLTETTARNASMESELNIARDIQMAMLPKTFPPYPKRADIDIFGQLTPAKAVGGDLYDFYIRDEKLFFCIGDVSGKGVPASLVMAVTTSQFRTLSATEDRPEMIVKGISESMCARNESLMFVTLFVGVLDLSSGVLHYCNAGHDAPVLAGRDKPGYLAVDPNVPVGIMPGWEYTAQEAVIDRGTTIFGYTDGLTEAADKDEALFGEERMLQAIASAESFAPDVLIRTVEKSVHEFVADAEQSDDLTMLALRLK